MHYVISACPGVSWLPSRRKGPLLQVQNLRRGRCVMIKKISALLLVGAVACATSPTGRRQLKLLPEGQMNQMGAQAFTQLKQQTPIESDARANAFVKCIAQSILAVTPAQQGQS